MRRKKSSLYEEKIKNTFLYKKADDGDNDDNSTVVELINQEAFSTLSKKYPDIVPYIMGFKETDQIDEGTILTSAIISNGSDRLIIPIIYSSGKVKADSYIYNPDSDIILALTKKVVKFLMDSDQGMGGPVSGNNINLDSGNIKKLFVPPQTWSPKIASHSFLPQLIETNSVVRSLLLEKLSSDKYFKHVFEIAYGGYAKELEKEAQDFKTYNSIPTEIVSNFEEIRTSERLLNKEAAVKEYANYGIYIQHGKNTPSKSLVKVASFSDRARTLLGHGDVETIGKNSGCFKIIDSASFTLEHVLVLPMFKIRNNRFYILDFYGSQHYEEYNDFVGAPDENCSFTRMKFIPVTPQNLISNIPNAVFVISKDGMPDAFIPYLQPNRMLNNVQLITNHNDSIIVNINFGDIKKIVIKKNSADNPISVGNVLIVGDKNISLYKTGLDPRKYMTYNEFTARNYSTNNNREIIKVGYSNGDYYMNGKVYSVVGLANKLVKEGFDKYSIYGLMKEAKDKGQTEVAAVSAKLDLLTQLITSTLGEVKKLEGKVDFMYQQNGATPDMDMSQQMPDDGSQQMPDDGSQQMPDDMSQQMPDDGSQQMPDDGSQQLDPQTQAAIAMDAQNNQQAQAPSFSLQQDSQPMPEDTIQNQGVAMPQQDNSEQAQATGLTNGVNPMANPDVVQMLTELKDSNVMDTSLLTMLLANKNVSLVVNDQLTSILNGINGLGKVTFNVELNATKLTESMGNKKYKSVLNNLKSLFKNMTNLYIDLITKSQQFDTEEEE